MPGTLHCYAIFHLNLAFSSIEEEDRPQVVARCYWPLVDLVRRRALPIAIEAPAYTLEAAAAIDPSWLAALRDLVVDGPAEFVGSGYAQLIGPLVPPEVLGANLQLGNATYERLLGMRPRVAFVNEQAWSASLVRPYRAAGYEAVIMEWENPRQTHPEWPPERQYHRQRVDGQDGASIPILWNHTIAFQKLQRYAHGELELDEYVDYLTAHRGPTDRVMSIYGSDAEVFDYRPGRYTTEPQLHAAGEWDRLDALFTRLTTTPGVALVAPSRVLEGLDDAWDGQGLRLETTEKPVPVKKQAKYDLARWAITGRDDIGVNTACWRAYEMLRRSRAATADWQELCYLWSSDFRTHITDRRWTAYLRRLTAFCERLRDGDVASARAGLSPSVDLEPSLPQGVRLERRGRYLTVSTAEVALRLNCRRGLAIDALTFPAVSPRPLCGSVPHGYFEDIGWSADQYSGFLVLAAAGRPQITDLEAVDPTVGWDPASRQVVIRTCIPTSLGAIEKEIAVGVEAPRLGVRYRLHWPTVPLGTLRLGHVTLVPSSFDAGSLSFATHNGGETLEHFPLSASEVDHLVPVSHLVSCRGGLGATGGIVEIGDAATTLRIAIDQQAASLFPLVTMRRLGAHYFCRITLSARELDDTSRAAGTGRSPFIDHLSFAITAHGRSAQATPPSPDRQPAN